MNNDINAEIFHIKFLAGFYMVIAMLHLIAIRAMRIVISYKRFANSILNLSMFLIMEIHRDDYRLSMDVVP